jgi:hypothetical protein
LGALSGAIGLCTSPIAGIPRIIVKSQSRGKLRIAGACGPC